MEEKYISEEEYWNLRDNSDELMEYIDGQVYLLASPSVNHQRVSAKLSFELFAYFKDSHCEVLSAPFDVKLVKKGLTSKIVIPDISVLCNKDNFTSKRYEGVPALIVEIISPSNQNHDLIKKLNIYEKFGVAEYWIVNPLNMSISIFTLDENGHYNQGEVKNEGIIKSTLFNDFKIDLDYLFKDMIK